MVKKDALLEYEIGHMSFLIGIIVAVLFGIILPEHRLIAYVLACLGIIVGLLNITSKESTKFLVASIALLVSARSLQLIPFFGEILIDILKYIAILVAPAATVVALITIWKLAKEK